MTYDELIGALKRYGSTERDIVVNGIGVEPDNVRENVIAAPWWEPDKFGEYADARLLCQASPVDAIRLWDIHTPHGAFTYLKTGIGAPVFMDALLALGLTPCKNVLFWGSVGALDENIAIGDVAVPEYSIIGDGATRYLQTGPLGAADRFGQKAYPDKELTERLATIARRVCGGDAGFHMCRTFSIDTIAAQFGHIDEIRGLGCNTIEMETASAFEAARIMGIRIAALFSVSDNTVLNKSLISGRSVDEIKRRSRTRRELFPKIADELFFGGSAE